MVLVAQAWVIFFYTLKKCKNSYDYYIIFHTDPLRKGIFSNVKFNLSSCKSTKKFIADKKVLSIYWDVKHKIFDFKTPYLVCKYHLTNTNIPKEINSKYDVPQNNLDKLGGLHHMSNRLLFALDVSKLFHCQLLKKLIYFNYK